jgi:release factor glutamine methyltransferase
LSGGEAPARPGATGLLVRDALDAAVTALSAAGCSTPRLDAEVLIAEALGADRGVLHGSPDLAMTGGQARVISERVRRRVAREPVAYILGRRGFRRIEVSVDPRVLIPRPETELLVEVALELPSGSRVHDVGTGSGAVALALLDERPDLVVSASDASAAAVEVARANAARLGLPLEVSVQSGLPLGNEGRVFDLVLANLPYVREDEWDGLAPEIRRYEPREALVAGPDGLDAIRSLVDEAPSGTRLALEHAPGQAATVRGLLRDARTHTDLAGRERVTVGLAP